MRTRARIVFIGIAASLTGARFSPAMAQEAYKRPPQAVIDIIDAKPTPLASVSPTRDALLLIEYDAYPSIELLSRPFLKLAGIRVDPELHARSDAAVHGGLSRPRRWCDAPWPSPKTRRFTCPRGRRRRRFAFMLDTRGRCRTLGATGRRSARRWRDRLTTYGHAIRVAAEMLIDSRRVPQTSTAPAVTRIPNGPSSGNRRKITHATTGLLSRARVELSAIRGTSSRT